jgi:hypothetical protein
MALAKPLSQGLSVQRVGRRPWLVYVQGDTLLLGSLRFRVRSGYGVVICGGNLEHLRPALTKEIDATVDPVAMREAEHLLVAGQLLRRGLEKPA